MLVKVFGLLLVGAVTTALVSAAARRRHAFQYRGRAVREVSRELH